LTIKRILVAVDGSGNSIKASKYAIDIAKKMDASLTVLYVLSPATYMDLGYANVGRMGEIEYTKKKHAQHEVEKVKKQAMENDVTVMTDVRIKDTSVAKEILEYAERNKIDLIITGSRGMTGIKKMLLGSVATGVVTYSHCPVLVVK
jgi:nucleotide-binding universal stress UspA family protein